MISSTPSFARTNVTNGVPCITAQFPFGVMVNFATWNHNIPTPQNIHNTQNKGTNRS